MTTIDPFGNQSRSGLSLKRRGHVSIQTPTESLGTESTAPFSSDGAGPHGHAALQAAWDKLYKARSILEAEQNHLRDDRIALQGEFESLQMREHAVAAHELRIQQIELQTALALEDEKEERDSKSALSKLTRAPFEIARSVFGSKK
jgi:hypothetical protein